jgi:hypothetical protein
MRKILIILITIVFCLTARISYPQELMERFKPYIIKKGDTLSKIAPPTHWDIIQRVNRIDERCLVPGKKILIPEDFEKAVWFCPVPKRISNQNFKKILYFFWISNILELTKTIIFGCGDLSLPENYLLKLPRVNFWCFGKTKTTFQKNTRYQCPMP